MKLIVINDLFDKGGKTVVLREIEQILIKHQLMKKTQLKHYRNLVAKDLIKFLNDLNQELSHERITVI
jgi:hypothetical protein